MLGKMVFLNYGLVQKVRKWETITEDGSSGKRGILTTSSLSNEANVKATSNAQAGRLAKQTASESGSAHSRARRANGPWLTNLDSASACYVNDDVTRSLPIGVAFTKKLFILFFLFFFFLTLFLKKIV